MSNITEKCMIVRLSISLWTARKIDKKATDKVIADFHAGDDAGRFNKLLVDYDTLRQVNRYYSVARGIHNSMTLPWADDGARILPAELFLQYTKRIQEVKEQFNEAVRLFVSQYEALKEQARKKLNGLFNEADYPPVEVIAKKFNISIEVEPIPAASDFRVTLSKKETEAIRAEIEERTTKRFSDAMKDVFNRLYQAANNIAEKCKDADSIFRDSLIGNLRELLEVLPSLNITNDPALAKAIKEAKPLAQFDPQALRDDPVTRSEAAQKAEALAKKLKGFIL
jgi:hypothetical protein